MIHGGYYIKARKIQDSEIANAPPHVREIWDWLIKEANHTDIGDIKRGSMMRSLNDVGEGLCWYVGYRKERYSKSKCEMAMNWLRKRGMIQTTKTTRGMLITICNYDTYQDPKSYETNSEILTKPTRNEQGSDTINKKDKNVKNEKNYKGLYEKIKFDYEISESQDELFLLWLKHKSEKGQAYKETGLRTLIQKHIDEPVSLFRQGIEHSIEKNYSGIYYPKIDQKRTNSASNEDFGEINDPIS